MQGRLRNQDLTAVIETECACCGREIRLEIDSELRIDAMGAAPLVCTPFVDVSRLGPSIIDGF